MHASSDPAPVFPGDQLEKFLASCLASTNPWTALQDALWEFGIVTQHHVEPPAVDPSRAVNAPGETWPERVRWRRQNCRPTHVLRIEETCGRLWQDWQNVLQWAALMQYQAFTRVKGNDVAMDVCFGSEHTRYVVHIEGAPAPFDYPLRDAYEPLMWRAWRAQQGHPLVKQFGAALEPQDMDAVLAEHLMRYQGRGPSPEEALLERAAEEGDRERAEAAGREYEPLAYPRPWRSGPWVPVVGYIDWPEGRFKGLFAATINAFKALVHPDSKDSIIAAGYFMATGDGSDEQIHALDYIASESRIQGPSVLAAPGDALLRADAWRALHEAARDDVDTTIITRRWPPYDRKPFSEPFKTIAKDLGISPQAVSKRWRRLRAAVGDLLPEPVRRTRQRYKEGERKALRQDQREDFLRHDLDAPQPVRLLVPEEDPRAFYLPTLAELRTRRTPFDDELDAIQLDHGHTDFAEDSKVVHFPSGSVTRCARWGIKGVVSALMDTNLRNVSQNARDGMSGWGNPDLGFMTPDGFSVPMQWRPGEASRGRRHRLTSVKKATRATESSDREWHVIPSDIRRAQGKEDWTIAGLGRRGPDGPAGLESAGFGEFNIEGRQDGPRLTDGRPLPPMPEEL